MRVRFGECILDSESRQFLRGRECMRLSPKAFDLLTLLLDARPKAVSKAQIHDRLWPETFVTETNLTGLVAEIRSAIGENRRDARFLRTVHGFGYAFSDEAVEMPPSEPSTRPRGGLGRLIWAGHEYVLREGENVLGRTADALVWIDASTVSRRHAHILVSAEQALLEDLGSKNGTLVGGRRIEGPTLLADGDEIRLGSVKMSFHRFAGAGSTDTARRPPAGTTRG